MTTNYGRILHGMEDSKHYWVWNWINERGYQVPKSSIQIWTHDKAEHEWILISGDDFGEWDEIECMPLRPTNCAEAWDCIDNRKWSTKDLDDRMLKMEQSYRKYA